MWTQICTKSLPVVAVVNKSQEPRTRGPVFWDNAFGVFEGGVVPSEVPWKAAAAALDAKWTAECGRNLTRDNLHFLACKAFRYRNRPTTMYYTACTSRPMAHITRGCKCSSRKMTSFVKRRWREIQIGKANKATASAYFSGNLPFCYDDDDL